MAAMSDPKKSYEVGVAGSPPTKSFAIDSSNFKCLENRGQIGRFESLQGEGLSEEKCTTRSAQCAYTDFRSIADDNDKFERQA